MAKQDAWEDLNALRMSSEDSWTLIRKVHGCTATWARKDGHPMAVWVTHTVMDEAVWVSTTENRPKTKAWMRDPRTSLVFESSDMGAVTIVGTVQLVRDPARQTQFLESLADRLAVPAENRASWIRHMDTPGRVLGKMIPEKWITFDQRKLEW